MPRLYIVAIPNDGKLTPTFVELKATVMGSVESLNLDEARAMDDRDLGALVRHVVTVFDENQPDPEPLYIPDRGREPELPIEMEDPDAWRSVIEDDDLPF